MLLRSPFIALALACLAAACSAKSPGGNPGDPDAKGSGSATADAHLDGDGAVIDPPDATEGGPIDAKPMQCASNPPFEPFGRHAHPYAAGVIQPNHVSQATLDDATAAFYDKWKTRYLVQGCGAGRYYVGYVGKTQTVSEAHGYGMLISVLMAGHDPDAHTIFDGEYHYYDDHRSTNQHDLMAWKQKSCANVEGPDSATDGDLDVAYALLLADKQWGSGGAIDYLAEAKKIINGIMVGDANSGHDYLLLGDWVAAGNDAYDSTRGSDFMPQHLASFAAATGGEWTHLLDGEYTTFSKIQTSLSPNTGLIPDFILHPKGTVAPAAGGFLEGPHDGEYSYNSCRVPWRIATHFVTSGDPRAKAIAQKLNGWIKSSTGGDPGKIMAGYDLAGKTFVDYQDMAFTAPFGVGAMVDSGNQAWLNDLWDAIQDDSDPGYFGDSIKLISMIVISGNWWVPEASSCQ
jgi:endo-1,4-beta-D-glucanase Y